MKKTFVFILILILYGCINFLTVSAAGLQGMLPVHTSGVLSGDKADTIEESKSNTQVVKPNTATDVTNPGNLLGTTKPNTIGGKSNSDENSETAKSNSGVLIITNIAGFLGGKDDADYDVVLEEEELDIAPEEEPSISNKPLVLTYHRISDVEKSNAFTITSEMFENDIKKLKEMGYTFGTADDLKNYSEDDQRQMVIITFDDGYESDYTIAMPILEKYNACATFFVIGSNIGAKEYMSREQLKALSLSKSAQIGSHSYEIHHLSFDEVFEIYKEEHERIIYDFKRNRAILEEIIGKDVTTYSFPYGIYSRQVVAKLNHYGISSFSSVENIDKVAPYGRFNRPYDLTLEEVIERARKTGK